MDWAVAQGHSAVAELLVLREMFFLTPNNSSVRDMIINAQQMLTEPNFDGRGIQLDQNLVVHMCKALVENDVNVLSILMKLEVLFNQALFEGLAEYCRMATLMFMDACKSKEIARCLLTPLPAEPQVQNQPIDVIEYAVFAECKSFTAHKHVRTHTHRTSRPHSLCAHV